MLDNYHVRQGFSRRNHEELCGKMLVVKIEKQLLLLVKMLSLLDKVSSLGNFQNFKNYILRSLKNS